MQKNPFLGLKPAELWDYFFSITQIPRPSKHEEAIEEFVMNFGKKLGLETIKDEANNILIRKPATIGMEKRKITTLQCHLDMVPEKNNDVTHDFLTDPIHPYIVDDGMWVKAQGTTLGADNGIGVAAAMFILASTNIQHGPLEALFTHNEESGMVGAFGLTKTFLNGDILLNLDSEDWGEVFIGCAGGTNANIIFNYREEAVPNNHASFVVSLTGLKGGHSGCDIDLYRANAIKLIVRFLWQASRDYGLRLSTIEGCALRNAIPREAYASFSLPKKNIKAINSLAAEMNQNFQKEYATVDAGVTLSIENAKYTAFVMKPRFQNRLLNALYVCPNDVIRFSNDMKGLVETSTNLSNIKSAGGKIYVQCLLRSSVNSAQKNLKNMFLAVFQQPGVKIKFDGEYPGWKPNTNSEILEVMKKVHKDLFGAEPQVKAIHAGLECGLIGGIYPNLDMISFGPTIQHPHSPDERLNIATVEKFSEYLKAVLVAIPAKEN
ncbi:aminoacyl-histidine dipeptidase [Candidatus Gracilibacteria bacterium]|nr:aminoacyl-histidine dipeptidase [Candidatus Gracilibacteria bacterium]